MVHTRVKVNREKTLPDERYDEKLFQQALKAAKEAKVSEKKRNRRRNIYKAILVFIGLSIFPLLYWIYISLKPPYYEYIEAQSLPVYKGFEMLEETVATSVVQSSNDIEVSATSAMIFEPDSGSVLFQKNINERRPIASLTKLVSALVLLDTYDLDQSVEVSTKNLGSEVTWRMDLEDGQSVTIQDLLEAMMISSYNDAAYAVANAYPIGGYEGFLDAMNKKASDLDMGDSHFSNPAGLDDMQNYGTANDVAKLVSAVINHEELLDITKKGSAIVSWKEAGGGMQSKTIYTTNKLFGMHPYISGLKTGNTDAAAECFVGYFVYPSGKRVITIVLGSEDRFKDTEILENAVRSRLK